MKLIKAFIVSLLFTTAAFGQALPIRNDTPTALRDLGSNLQVGRNFAVDQYGRLQCTMTGGSGGGTASVIPVSNATGLNGFGTLGFGLSRVTSGTVTTGSTTTVIQITGIQAAGARVNDYLQLTTPAASGNSDEIGMITAVSTNSVTVSPGFTSAPANADGYRLLRPVPISAASNLSQNGTQLMVGIDYNYQLANATGILKAEDAAHSSGDAGVMALAVRNSGWASLTNTDGDYSPIATDVTGRVGVSLSTTNLPSADLPNQPIRLEDSAFGNSEALMMAGAVNNRNWSVFNSTNGDATPIGVTDIGAVLSILTYDAAAGSNSAVQLEDNPIANAQSLVMAGVTYQTTPAQSAGTTGDASVLQNDAIGALWARPAPNQDTGAIITASGATTTQTSADQTNYSGKCVSVTVDMTVNAGSLGSITCTIQGKDTASGKYYTVLAGAAIAAVSTTTYQVCPGMTAVANSVANGFLPKTWRVNCVANNANATTYTVGASIVN